MAQPPCGQPISIVIVLYRAISVLFFTAVFFLHLITCLLLNLAQLVNWILFHYTVPTLARYINYALQDMLLSQFTTIVEWYCGVRFRLFFDNEETEKQFGHEHSLVLGNHCFQIDGIFYWLTSEMTNTLGAVKAYAKTQLRFMPILGWAFYFGEFIFLKRNWKEDAKNIGPMLDTLMHHPYPILVLLLPEGTRFTPEKYQAAQIYAKENNIPVKLKYHLLPRVKGFAATLKHLRKNYDGKFGVYNIQLLSHRLNDPDVAEPNMANVIAGKPFKVDCHVSKIDSATLPPADANDDELAKFLYSVFEQKDQLVETHRQYSHFPQSVRRVKQRCVYRLARFILLNFAITGSLVGYLIYLAMITHSLALRITIYGLIITVFTLIFLIMRSLQNSQYGADKKKNKQSSTAKRQQQQQNESKTSIQSEVDVNGNMPNVGIK